MEVIWEKDGIGLGRDGDGDLWLYVRDANGSHETGLTDEARRELIAQLRALEPKP